MCLVFGSSWSTLTTFSSEDCGEMRRDAEMEFDIICRRQLEWLGHVARMPDDRFPKQLCFGCQEKTWPPEDPRLRWKDRVTGDMKKVRIPNSWYQLVQDRQAWHEAYSVNMPVPPPRQLFSVRCVTARLAHPASSTMSVKNRENCQFTLTLTNSCQELAPLPHIGEHRGEGGESTSSCQAARLC